MACGTSLPELAATVRAAMSKESDMAIGNVVGSNIFNLLSVLGITSLVRPLTMPAEMDVHIWAMLAISVVLVVMVLFRPKLRQWIGIMFVVGYGLYGLISFVGPGLFSS